MQSNNPTNNANSVFGLTHKKRLGYLAFGLTISLSSIGFITPSTSSAETLQLPTAPSSYSVTFPGRGMSMTEVLDKFGEPESKDPEVGEPPITRWHYKNFAVIFEYQYVIHSLSTNKPIGLKQPTQTDEVTQTTNTTNSE